MTCLPSATLHRGSPASAESRFGLQIKALSGDQVVFVEVEDERVRLNMNRTDEVPKLFA